MYVGENWILKTKNDSKLLAFEMSSLCRTAIIQYAHRITNVEARQRLSPLKNLITSKNNDSAGSVTSSKWSRAILRKSPLKDLFMAVVQETDRNNDGWVSK